MKQSLIKRIHRQINICFTQLLNLLYPKLCSVCDVNLLQAENDICLTCLHALPKSHIQRAKSNQVFDTFNGRIWIQQAYAHFLFSKGNKVQLLLHAIKYYNYQTLAVEMGRKMGENLKEIFDPVDVIVPIPLHPKKLYARGYNQSYFIAQGVSEALNIPVLNDAVVRIKHDESLTGTNRIERWETMSTSFTVSNSNALKNKNILILDDVITTGATLEALASKILEVPDTKVSIAALAFAQLN